MVIHAGDFGFYNESSYKHISSRELYLLISHSPYRQESLVDKTTPRETLIEIVRRHNLLGDFQAYQDMQKQFIVPTYAVYGNHEDVHVIREVKNNAIKNLHLLDEDTVFKIEKNSETQFQVFGIGGNFLVNNKLLQKPIAGASGKVWATLHQFGVLYQQLEKKSKPSIFVSHVSPGKESLLTRLVMHFMPNF